MFARIQRSWELTKQSAAVLTSDKELLLFPVLSSAATLLVIASFVVPLFLSGFFHIGRFTPAKYLVVFAFYFCNYFVTIFFNCALMGAAGKALNGQHATLSDGINMATQRLGRIVVWALVAATVGMLLRIVEERAGRYGRIIFALLGAAWSVLTYFIAPVIVFENLGVTDGVKRSAELIKKTWGEGAFKGVTFAAFTLLAMVPLIALGALAFYLNLIVVGVVFVVTYVALLATVISAMDGIFKVALYQYASQGVMAKAFHPQLLQAAFAQKS